MALSIDTVRTNIYTDLYNHLQTGTYAISTDNIHPSWNDVQQRSEGMPQVIITNISVSEEKLTHGANGLYSIPFTVMFECYHNSAANARTIADEIHSKLRGDGKVFLKSNSLRIRGFDDDDYERIPWSQGKSNHIYRMTMNGMFIGSP